MPWRSHTLSMLVLSIVLLGLEAVSAANQAIFRLCDQNPFCGRNRGYAQAALSDSFVSPYTLEADSIEGPRKNQLLRGTIRKSLPHNNFVDFDLVISLTPDLSFRVQIDEPDRTLSNSQLSPARFTPMSYISVLSGNNTTDYSEKISSKLDGNRYSQTIAVDDARSIGLEVDLKPFKLSFYENGKLVLTMNQDNLLNIEQLRSKSEDSLAWNEWELQTGAWEDVFDSNKDEKAKGPEAIAADLSFHGFRHVYGIPEHADILSLRNTNGEMDADGNWGHTDPYRLWNVDIFEYDVNSTLPMYGSIPFMMAHRPGLSVGLFWANAADTYIDIAKSDKKVRTHWMSETGVLEFFVMMSASPAGVLEAYGHITGMAALPQQFGIGYHQCRWNYNSEDDVLDVSAKFDVNNLPMDVIWLDIEYTESKKYFTWNSHQFPKPDRMLSELDKSRRKLVAIIDPHIKVEAGYRVYEGLLDQSLAIHDNKGNPFHGHCWPGESIWVDTFNPASYKFLENLYAMGDELGYHAENIHIWNDMNEPSVFSGPETTAPKDLVHFGGLEHRDIHNLYGQTFMNATYEAMLTRYSRKMRPFILTRSYFAGSQRYGPMWTGDNQGTWDYLKIASPMILTSGMAGMPFAGADVGGFFGNPEPELLTRWYQAGVFYPFFRGHAHIDSRRREPYLPAEPYKSIIAAALNLRYQLLPMIYTKFWEASQTLAPIARPLFYEVPNAELTYAIDDQFFFGDALLFKPVTASETAEIDILLPEDQIYYDYWTNQAFRGPTTLTRPVSLADIPLYNRGGKIYARRDRPRRSAELMANDPYTLVVSVGVDHNAEGQLYMDDGISFDYETGVYTLVDYQLENDQLSSKVLHQGQGSYDDLDIEKIVIIGTEATGASVNGEKLHIIPSEARNTLLIRKPNLTISSDWVIDLEFN